jgi:hypothetical protein
MAQVYDESNYRREPPAPTYKRPMAPVSDFVDNLLDPYSNGVINESSLAGPMLGNAGTNFALDAARQGASATNFVSGGRFGSGTSDFLGGKGFTAFDRAQSAIGPVANFLSGSNPSNNPDPNNRYGQLALDSAAEAVNYIKMRPSLAAIPAWAFSGSVEGWENANSARKNAMGSDFFMPEFEDDEANNVAADRVLNGAYGSWGRGSGYGMLPFNPYARVSSALKSESDRVRSIINAGHGEDDKDVYYKILDAELEGLANLIRAAAEEEDDRANPFSIFKLGGTVGRRQAWDTLTGSAGDTKQERDAHTIKLLLDAQSERKAHEEHIKQARADPTLADAVMTF